MIDEKILQKIQNLFKLAENNPNENEAQTALLMAQKIMAKNGIEQSEVDNFGFAKKKEAVKEHATDIKRLTWWEKNLAVVIARNFRCEIFISKTRQGGRVTFLGLKDDVNLAKIVYNFACSALLYNTNRFVNKYKNLNPNYHVGIKNDFMLGWVNGLDSKYKEQVEKNNWGLILVKDPLVQEALAKIHLKKGQSSSISRRGDDRAYSDGYSEGRKFNSPTGMIK